MTREELLPMLRFILTLEPPPFWPENQVGGFHGQIYYQTLMAYDIEEFDWDVSNVDHNFMVYAAHFRDQVITVVPPCKCRDLIFLFHVAYICCHRNQLLFHLT